MQHGLCTAYVLGQQFFLRFLIEEDFAPRKLCITITARGAPFRRASIRKLPR